MGKSKNVLQITVDTLSITLYHILMEQSIHCTRQELEEWYNAMTIQELRDKLGYGSNTSVYRLLAKAGIPFKGSPNLRKRGTVKLISSE